MTKGSNKFKGLLLIGKPGKGKSTALENVCNSEGYSLEKIDCCLYDNFGDIKKQYNEAVRSQVVERVGMAGIGSKGRLGGFFKGPDLKTEKMAEEASMKKVFLFDNIDHLLKTREDSEDNNRDKTIKNCLDFASFSNFPFVIETHKSGRNLISSEQLYEFDRVELKSFSIEELTVFPYIIIKLELLGRHPSVKAIPRYKDQNKVATQKYGELFEDNRGGLERVVQELGAGLRQVVDCRLSLKEVRNLVLLFDSNLSSLLAKLSYYIQYSDQSETFLKGNALGLINNDFISEYRHMPAGSDPFPLTFIDPDSILNHPPIIQAFDFTSIQNYLFFINESLKALFVTSRPEALSILECMTNTLHSQSAPVEIDVFRARELIYLSHLDEAIAGQSSYLQSKAKEYEMTEFLRLLEIVQPELAGAHFGRKSRVKEYRGCNGSERSRLQNYLEKCEFIKESGKLYKNMAKRFSRRGWEIECQCVDEEQSNVLI